jgi:hypothetical protein
MSHSKLAALLPDVGYVDARGTNRRHPGESHRVVRIERGMKGVAKRCRDEAPLVGAPEEPPNDERASRPRERQEQPNVGAVRHDLERGAHPAVRDGKRGGNRPVRDDAVERPKPRENRARATDPERRVECAEWLFSQTSRHARPPERVSTRKSMHDDRSFGQRDPARSHHHNVAGASKLARLCLYEVARRVGRRLWVAGRDEENAHSVDPRLPPRI